MLATAMNFAKLKLRKINCFIRCLETGPEDVTKFENVANNRVEAD